MVTDRIDGDLARSRGLVTNFGKVADPIADKALIGMALIGLSIIGIVPWWVTVVILVRESGITVVRFVVIRHGVMPAGRGGKLKTVLQTVAVGLLIFPLGGPAGQCCLAHCRLYRPARPPWSSRWSRGVDYLIKARRLRATSERTRAPGRPLAG